MDGAFDGARDATHALVLLQRKLINEKKHSHLKKWRGFPRCGLDIFSYIEEKFWKRFGEEGRRAWKESGFALDEELKPWEVSFASVFFFRFSAPDSEEDYDDQMSSLRCGND